MNGPEHARAADFAIRDLEHQVATGAGGPDSDEMRLGLALGHAVLALTAAVIDTNDHLLSDAAREQWLRELRPTTGRS